MKASIANDLQTRYETHHKTSRRRFSLSTFSFQTNCYRHSTSSTATSLPVSNSIANMSRSKIPPILEFYPDLFPENEGSHKKKSSFDSFGTYPTFKPYDTFEEKMKLKWMKAKPIFEPHVLKVRIIVAYKVWTDKIRRFVMNDPMPDFPLTPCTPATPRYMWFDQVNFRPVYVR